MPTPTTTDRPCAFCGTSMSVATKAKVECCTGGSDCWCWIEREREPQRWPGALENAAIRKADMERRAKDLSE